MEDYSDKYIYRVLQQEAKSQLKWIDKNLSFFECYGKEFAKTGQLMMKDWIKHFYDLEEVD